MTAAARNVPPCPTCGSTAPPLRILYGFPDEGASDAAERGEAAIGGCLVGPESPDYECRTCEAPLPWVAPKG